MDGNYEDIIDIILTFQEEELIKDKLIYSGSFIPYLMDNVKTSDYIDDVRIFVNIKDIDSVRKELYRLSKIFMFDIVFDSIKLTENDYGFKFKYETTIVTVSPYSFKEKNLYFRTFLINNDLKTISQRQNKMQRFSETNFFRTQNLNEDDSIYINTPEFLLIKEQRKEESNIEIINILKCYTDKKLLNIVKKAFKNSEVKVKVAPIKKVVINQTKILIGLLLLALIIFILYSVFK